MNNDERPTTELRTMLLAAKRIATQYGQIGLYDPDDIAQTAVIRLLRQKNRIQKPMRWLYKAVRSSVLDAARLTSRDRRRRWKYSINFELTLAEDQFDYAKCTGTNTESKYDLSQLQEMLQKLSEPLRQVLILQSEGRSYEEIAEITKANIGTVRSRIYYARKRARSLLAELN